jgi:transposase
MTLMESQNQRFATTLFTYLRTFYAYPALCGRKVAMAPVFSSRAKGFHRHTIWLGPSEVGPRSRDDAWSDQVTSSGAIEIEFAAGIRMRITGAVDGATLKAAVADLDGGTSAMIPCKAWRWRFRRASSAIRMPVISDRELASAARDIVDSKTPWHISRSLLMTWRRALDPEQIGSQSEPSGFVRVVPDAAVEPAVTAPPTSGQMVIVVGRDRRIQRFSSSGLSLYIRTSSIRFRNRADAQPSERIRRQLTAGANLFLGNVRDSEVFDPTASLQGWN